MDHQTCPSTWWLTGACLQCDLLALIMRNIQFYSGSSVARDWPTGTEIHGQVYTKLIVLDQP